MAASVILDVGHCPDGFSQGSSGSTADEKDATWSGLHQDLLLAVLAYLPVRDLCSVRLTSATWREAFDGRIISARGSLRDSKLPPLPSCCSAIRRVTLRFDAPSVCTTCTFMSDVQDATSARYALARLKLERAAVGKGLYSAFESSSCGS